VGIPPSSDDDHRDREPGNVVTSAADERRAHAAERASVLAEALPYIREFADKTVVVKVGGHAMDDPELAGLFAEDIVLMRLVGLNPVVVHGGGPQISELMRRLGKEPTFLEGQRVTDAETVDIVRMALVGKVNRELVAGVNRHGPYAVGLSGEDAGLLTVSQRDERLGFVGEVQRLDPSILLRLLREELIPVVATIGVDTAGQAYNVNADVVAAEIAAALGAEKLVYLTDVAGIYERWPDESSLIARTDVAGLKGLVADGAVSEGMIPKVESILAALDAGVHRAHVLDGRVEHALLLEFFTDSGIGTMVESDRLRAGYPVEPGGRP